MLQPQPVSHQPLHDVVIVVKVVPREEETPIETLRRFSRKVYYKYRRPWYKRRYGYYEKPGKLRHKCKRNRSRNRYGINRGSPPMKGYISLDAQFDKNAPDNAVGR